MSREAYSAHEYGRRTWEAYSSRAAYSSREAYSSLLVSGGVLGVAKSMRLCYVTRGAGMRLGVGAPSV